MKKSTIIILTVLMSALVSVITAHAGRPLVMAFNETVSPPWKWIQDGRYAGPFLDVMQEVAARSGIEVVLTPKPWARVLKEVEAGSIDGAFGGYKTPEREQTAVFLDAPMAWTVIFLFVKKEKTFPFGKIEDLYGKGIGIVRGYTTGAEFDRAMQAGKIKVESAGSYQSLVKMLQAGRVEGVAATTTILAHFADMNLAGRFVKLPHPVTDPIPIYICLSKRAAIEDRDATIARMNRAMAEMQKDNAFEKIAATYGYDRCAVFGCPVR